MARKWGKKAKEAPEKDSLAPDTLNVEDEDTLTPEDIENMSDEEFNEYLERGQDADLDEDLEDLEGEEEKTEEEEEETDLDTTPEDDKAEPESKAEPFKTFETEADYEAEVEKRVNEALKDKPKADNKDKDVIDRIKRIAKKYFKDTKAPLEDVAMELEKQYAEHEGIDIDTLRESMDTEDDAEKWRNSEKDKADKEARDKGKKDFIDKLNRDAESLKAIVSDFDLKEALKDKKFYNAILDGKSVLEAYNLMDKPEKAEDKPETDEEKEEKPERKNVENGLLKAKGTGSGRNNPATLSESEFKKYIDNIKNS